MARYELKLPHMGESVAEATITSWLKKVGETIEADDIIVEVATDKVDSQIPCEVSGVVTQILFETDQVVQVGEVMAIIETEQPSEIQKDETNFTTEIITPNVAPQLQTPQSSTQNIVNNTISSSDERFYSPLVKNIAIAENISTEELQKIQGTGQDGRVTKNDILAYLGKRNGGLIANTTATTHTQTQEIQPDNAWASWASGASVENSVTENSAQTQEIQPDNAWASWASGASAENSVTENSAQTQEISFKEEKTENSDNFSIQKEVSNIEISSEIKEEKEIQPLFTHKIEFEPQVQETQIAVDTAKEEAKPIVPPKTTPTSQTITQKNSDDIEVIEMTRMGKLISKYMVQSKQTSPHVQSFTEVDVTRIWNWRNKIKKKFEQREGEKFTFTPIFIEAVAKALRDFPMMNISTDGERIFKKKHINIGMATALPNGDLIVPVIKNADTLSLVGLAKTVNDLANRARANQLKPDDITGGTYTVTNIGSFGNVFGTPIINQPEVGILAIGAIQKVPAVIETPEGDVIGIRYKMMLSHSYDHRVVNGALGGMFVQRVAQYLEKWDTERDI